MPPGNVVGRLTRISRTNFLFGHVTSLPRPGGNITGLSVMQSDLTAKALAILKETVPQATRFGVFWNSTVASGRPTLQSAEAAGTKLGIQISSVPVRTSKDFDGAFATMARERVGGVFVAASTLTRVERTPLAQLAIKYRLPSMGYEQPEPLELPAPVTLSEVPARAN